MSAIVVIGVLQARPGQEDAAREVMSSLVEPTHAETGCRLYALHEDVDAPGRFVFVEHWASRQDLDTHLKSPHIARLLERADELLAGRPEVTICTALPAGEPAKGGLPA
jgi:quinol monooxygenase YgiN